MRFLGDLGCLVVTDLRVQRGHQHQRIVDMLLDIGFDGLDAFCTVFVEAVTAVADEPGAVEEVIDHDGFEDVELEMTRGPADIDGDIIAQYLRGDHRQRLALRGVDLAGHDGRAGFVVGDMELPDPAAGAGGKHPDVIGYLHQADGHCLQGAMRFDNSVVCGQGLEFIGGGDKGQPGEFGDLSRHILRITRRSVDPRADGRAAKRQFGKMGKRILYRPYAMVQLSDITAELLADGERSGIHKVGTPDLYHLHILLALVGKGIAQGLDTGDRGLHKDLIGGDMHGRGKGVVGRLGLVDIIIGMQYLFFIGELPAVEYMAAISNHLVDVHIALGPAPGLPDDKGEIGVETAAVDLVTDLADKIGFFLGKDTRLEIDDGGGLFQVGKGADDLLWHFIDVLGDGEVYHTTLGLSAVVGIDGNLDLAHRVFFDPIFHNTVFCGPKVRGLIPANGRLGG